MERPGEAHPGASPERRRLPRLAQRMGCVIAPIRRDRDDTDRQGVSDPEVPLRDRTGFPVDGTPLRTGNAEARNAGRLECKRTCRRAGKSGRVQAETLHQLRQARHSRTEPRMAGLRRALSEREPALVRRTPGPGRGQRDRLVLSGDAPGTRFPGQSPHGGRKSRRDDRTVWRWLADHSPELSR